MWTVRISKKATKAVLKMPQGAQYAFDHLVREIRLDGPVRGNWPNYSKLDGNRHHCHIKKGKPCYVAVWAVINNNIRIIEVQYVGTHEKAPY